MISNRLLLNSLFGFSLEFTKQKLDYIHNNLMEEMFVEAPQEYLFSSARNYAGMPGLIGVFLI
jgi:hypothetical protein